MPPRTKSFRFDLTAACVAFKRTQPSFPVNTAGNVHHIMCGALLWRPIILPGAATQSGMQPNVFGVSRRSDQTAQQGVLGGTGWGAIKALIRLY